MKRWFVHNMQRALGTQAIMARLPALLHQAGQGPPTALATAAGEKIERFYQRLVEPAVDEADLGFQRGHAPCLIDMNGDLLWVPGDLLRYLWHTRVPGDPPWVLHFLAETPHYVWIRERLRSGDVAVDCGANLGLFSTMMARCVGPSGSVHAFEPSPGSGRDLARVLALNEIANVKINACAVCDTCGEATFCDVTEGDVRREASHLDSLGRVGLLGGLRHHEVRVPTITLDHYVAGKGIAPRLVKIDVEGAEFLVLEGARRAIAASRPMLVIEIHPDGNNVFDHARLKSYLRQYGYQHECQDKTYYCVPR
jgi:FkbM family methyltransferase